MKQTINQSQFVQAFTDCGRGEQFSRAALEAIFEYIEIGDPNAELDPIAVCCEWTEYPTAIDAAAEYGELFSDEVEAIEWLEKRTTVIETGSGSIVIQSENLPIEGMGYWYNSDAFARD